MTAFLDTNIFLRHLRQDDPVLSPKATRIFAKIEKGKLKVSTSDTVIFETVFTLQRGYKESRDRIAAGVLPLLMLPGIILPAKKYYRSVFSLYCSTSLSFADSYHVIFIKRIGIKQIISFDHDFDKISGLQRIE